MKRLLIIQQHQFGYLTDSYKWCEYLKDKFKITVLCYYVGRPKEELPGVSVKYIGLAGGRLLRGLKTFLWASLLILRNNGPILIEFFEKCQFLKCLFPFKKMFLDIRTLSVDESQVVRDRHNKQIKDACGVFDQVFVISEGVKTKLGNLPKMRILPLGADVISVAKKEYNNLKLLYVGTFTNRHVERTIKGIKIFVDRFPEKKITYDIVGDGNKNELAELKQLVEELKLSSIIHLHGRIPYSQISPFFDKCNIGVSFVPMTEYYDSQTPTKTFEYALSGLYVLATKTRENEKVITNDNGVLIDDTECDFAIGLEKISSKMHNLSEKEIRSSLYEHTWNRLIETSLYQYIK